MSSPLDSVEMERLVDIFRKILTKDLNVLCEVNETLRQTPELLTRELSFTCGSIFDFADTGCACELDHENFRYISGDNVDGEVLDRITRSILCGQCVHHDSLPEEDEETVGPLPTSVTLAHAAAVVGNVSVLKILLQLTRERTPSTLKIRSTPLHLALLHNQKHGVSTLIESRDVDLISYCKTFALTQQNRNRPNAIDIEYMSTFELCLRMNNIAALKQILQHTALDATWIIDAMKSECDLVHEIISQYIDPELLGKFCNDEAERILHQGIRRGDNKLVEMLILGRGKEQYKCLPILLAVVYDKPKILGYLLNSNVGEKDIEINGFTLTDISNSLYHVECTSILQNHGIHATKRQTENPLHVMLEIGKRLRLGQYTDILIQKVGCKGEIKDTAKCFEELTFHSLRKFGGLGVRALLSFCRNVDAIGQDGLTPLALAMKHDINPCSLLDVLHSNPNLNQFEKNGLIKKHLQLFDRSNINAISMLALAIERDLKNYAIRKWALCYSGFSTYEGSTAVLLLDCGYDVRADELIYPIYPKLLEKRGQSGREDEIRSRIKDRIDRELYLPKPLKERCRDVLRRHFTGHSLNRYIESMDTPLSVRNFILMKSRLNVQQKKGIILCIEED